MIRLLTISSLFPNQEMPSFGIFVANRLKHLMDSGQVAARVVAPVPWFPWRHDLFGQYGRLVRVPKDETWHGVPVLHPRYAVVPKIGMSMTPRFMSYALHRSVRRMIADDGDIDLIDAHYFYPDGVAAANLGKRLGKPVVITARGTDLNVIADIPAARAQIQTAIANADGLITVSTALREKLLTLGADPAQVTVLRNGVDLHRFRPVEDREGLRKSLNLTEPVLLSVGNLVANKGHDLAIRALSDLPGITLLIAGEGPEEHALKALSERLGVAPRVSFLGRVDHADLRRYYAAADMLILATEREGWPNVLLEAMACGTPVIATNTGGVPEVVTDPVAGRLLATRSVGAVVVAVRELMMALPAREATRAYAEQYGWQETTMGQLDLFRKILANRRSLRK